MESLLIERTKLEEKLVEINKNIVEQEKTLNMKIEEMAEFFANERLDKLLKTEHYVQFKEDLKNTSGKKEGLLGISIPFLGEQTEKHRNQFIKSYEKRIAKAGAPPKFVFNFEITGCSKRRIYFKIFNHSKA